MSHVIRIIPRLDIKGPNLIKGLQFDGNRVLGSAAEFAGIYYEEGADELIYQDAVASLYLRNSLHDIVRKTADNIFVPLTVAGGIRSVKNIRELLRAGADKVAINTAATQNPKLLEEAAKAFGSQCIVSSIEAFRKGGKYQVWVDFGREVTELDAIQWAKQVENLGVGEILLTSINNEGMGRGYDLELIHAVSSMVSIPVIACGGAGCVEDFARAAIEAGADAISAASVFHYHYAEAKPKQKTMQLSEGGLRMGRQVDSGNIEFLNSGYGGQKAVMVEPCSVRQVKQHMSDQGIPVRLGQ